VRADPSGIDTTAVPSHSLFRSGTQQFASALFSLAAWIKEQDNEGGSSAASSGSMSHRRNEAFGVESFKAILLAVGSRVMTPSLHPAVQVQNELQAVDPDPTALISVRGGPS